MNPRSGLQLCFTDTTSQHPKLQQKETILLLSASVSCLKIPAVDSKPKRMMTNYTTMAEYYLQEGKQITLIRSVEGKNTPPNKKHRKHPARRSTQHMGNRPPPQLQDSHCLPLLPSLLFVLQMEIRLIYLFRQDTFGRCVLISGLSNYIRFNPDLRFQKRRQRRERLSPNL